MHEYLNKHKNPRMWRVVKLLARLTIALGLAMAVSFLSTVVRNSFYTDEKDHLALVPTSIGTSIVVVGVPVVYLLMSSISKEILPNFMVPPV